MVNSLNNDTELSVVLGWLLPLTSSEDGSFELDSNKYSDKIWAKKKTELHLLYCRKLIEYKDLTNNGHVLGRLRVEDLKIKEYV